MFHKTQVMRAISLLLLLRLVHGELWRNGIVHYTINNKDYDLHSQDVIISTLADVQNEICVKFFQTPLNYNVSNVDRILYINNPDKKKTCDQNLYNFSKSVLDMPIGYKCITKKEIASIVVDMLRASINPSATSKINSYDLVKNFKEKESDVTGDTLLSQNDRNYINAYYQVECGLASRPSHAVVYRRYDDSKLPQLSASNLQYYKDKLWPLGIVLYRIEENLRNSADAPILKQAMSTIELSSCVVFQELATDDVLAPKSIIQFSTEGEDMPLLGFVEGKQIVKLSSMIHGAPGHTGHTLNNLIRILGIHMMSNRYDRDNHVIINWKNVEQGKEQYLEKAPEEAWLVQIPYDFDSATHAPSNYMCSKCELGGTTVQPIQDHLWQRTMSMGHKKDLSESDVQIINLLYGKQCRNRFMTKND